MPTFGPELTIATGALVGLVLVVLARVIGFRPLASTTSTWWTGMVMVGVLSVITSITARQPIWHGAAAWLVVGAVATAGRERRAVHIGLGVLLAAGVACWGYVLVLALMMGSIT